MIFFTSCMRIHVKVHKEDAIGAFCRKISELFVIDLMSRAFEPGEKMRDEINNS